jgi:1,4-alpha-glucan branching enzyme
MLSKMPGDDWQRFANLRTLYGYMYAHPGKKLHFMGAEFGARKEWDENAELEWGLLDQAPHRQLQAYVRELNRLYRAHPALHEVDFSWEGFEWIDCEDAERSIVSFVRRSRTAAEFIVAAANFTPVPRTGYRLGVPMAGAYTELLNSDAAAYGGAGIGNPAPLAAAAEPLAGQPYSLLVTLPPLALVLFARASGAAQPPRGAKRPAPARS